MHGVWRERAYSYRASAGVFQNSLYFAAVHQPDHRGSICGAGSQVLPAGTEGTTVHHVAMARKRREGELAEVSGGINTNGLIP